MVSCCEFDDEDDALLLLSACDDDPLLSPTSLSISLLFESGSCFVSLSSEGLDDEDLFPSYFCILKSLLIFLT